MFQYYYKVIYDYVDEQDDIKGFIYIYVMDLVLG